MMFFLFQMNELARDVLEPYIDQVSQISIAAGVNSFDAKYSQASISHFRVVYLSRPWVCKGLKKILPKASSMKD